MLTTESNFVCPICGGLITLTQEYEYEEHPRLGEYSITTTATYNHPNVLKQACSALIVALREEQEKLLTRTIELQKEHYQEALAGFAGPIMRPPTNKG